MDLLLGILVSLLYFCQAQGTGLLVKTRHDVFNADLAPYGLSVGIQLGNGTYASVYTLNIVSNPPWEVPRTGFAAKVFDMANATTKSQSSIDREFSIGKQLSTHHSFLRVFSLVKGPRCWYLIMERAADSLYDVAVRKLSAGRADEYLMVLQEVFREVTEAVAYMHAQGIAHGDLKPDHVLLGEDGRAKLVDLGSAVAFCTGENCTVGERSWIKAAGTKPFLPPEAHPPGSLYDPVPADVWSLGILFIVAILKKAPWMLATSDDTEFVRFAGVQMALYPEDKCRGQSSPLAIDENKSVSPASRWNLFNRLPAEEMGIIAAMLELGPTRRLVLGEIRRR